MSDSMTLVKSLLSARAALLYEESEAPATLAILVVDASSSMQKYGDAPIRGVNTLLAGLKQFPGSDRAIGMVVAFSGELEVLAAPQRVQSIAPISRYDYRGGTKLYEASAAVLSLALDFSDIAEQYDSPSHVAISLMSDGWDRWSANGARDDARALAGAGRVRNFTLQAIGIGIDSRVLARDLGFEEQHSYTAEPSVQGIQRATEESSQLFSLSFLRDIRDAVVPPRDSTPTPR